MIDLIYVQLVFHLVETIGNDVQTVRKLRRIKKKRKLYEKKSWRQCFMHLLPLMIDY